MSHFSALVEADDEDVLDELLAPFEEDTDDQQYLKFEEAESIHADNKEWGEGKTLSQYAADNGYSKHEGVYGYWSNPNAKWDWWTVGGRWSKLLKLKPSKRGAVADSMNDFDTNYADVAHAGDVDWVGIRDATRDNAIKRHTKYHAIMNTGTDDERRQRLLCDNGFLWMPHDDNITTATPTEYGDAAYKEALTFAVLTADGEWRGNGNMGWWASVSNIDEGYDTWFWQHIGMLDGEQVVFVVDIHI